MIGVRATAARVTAVLLVLALCFPTASALALTTSSAPVQHSCCMRMAHKCHPQQPSGDSLQAVCHDCGWCHALPTGTAGPISATVDLHIAITRAALHVRSESRPSPAPSRLHASRAPPRVTTALL